MGEAMREAGLKEAEEYITLRHNTSVQYITMWPIMDLYEKVEIQSVMQVSKRWWY